MEGHYSEAINRKYKNSQGAQQGVMQQEVPNVCGNKEKLKNNHRRQPN
jgi:hypothetical protein